MRVFIAICLPEKVREKIFNLAGKLYEKNLFKGKVIEKENLHLTLKFLGEIDEEKIEKVKEKLREISFKKFSAKVGVAGVFSENFVRIIWLKIEGCGELQKEIDEKLEDLFEKERRFMGHLTIVRVKSCERKKLLEEIGKIKISDEFNVESFELVKSELSPSGPVYGVLESFKLK